MNLNLCKRWTFLTNVSHVDFQGTRLWCHAVLIDDEPSDGLGDRQRQIRGMAWGGLPVFTLWIDPAADVTLTAEAGGQTIMLSHDGNTYNLDSGILVTAGDIKFGISPDDYRKPIRIETIDHVPFGDEVDHSLFEFAGGIYYPRVVWTSVPR